MNPQSAQGNRQLHYARVRPLVLLLIAAGNSPNALFHVHLTNAHQVVNVSLTIVHGAVNERLESDGGTRGDSPLQRLEQVLDQIY